ncbi:hypothetical protein HDU76_002341 [Blyttiomyces sp. JEL0837]|nr:hypothetical protein HDU76_002341 [Blyttiomyces sp. JEL0837]
MATRIVVTEGVVGGFVAPVPKKSVILDFDPSTKEASIQLHTKRQGTRDTYDVMEGKAAALTSDVQPLVADILSTFRSLPKEEPTGCEDVYGM